MSLEWKTFGANTMMAHASKSITLKMMWNFVPAPSSDFYRTSIDLVVLAPTTKYELHKAVSFDRPTGEESTKAALSYMQEVAEFYAGGLLKE